jgi:hypothetical protein
MVDGGLGLVCRVGEVGFLDDNVSEMDASVRCVSEMTAAMGGVVRSKRYDKILEVTWVFQKWVAR